MSSTFRSSRVHVGHKNFLEMSLLYPGNALTDEYMYIYIYLVGVWGVYLLYCSKHTWVSVVVKHDLAKRRGKERPKHFINPDSAVSFEN